MDEFETRNWIAMVLALVVPGAGHFFLGQRGRGTLFFVSLVSVYLFGLYLGSRPPIEHRLANYPGDPPPFRIISPKNHPFHFTIQALAGVPTLAAVLVNKAKPVDSPTIITDLGLVITLVVGALNFLLIVDALCCVPEKDAKRTPS